jgi:hypothetical protein
VGRDGSGLHKNGSVVGRRKRQRKASQKWKTLKNIFHFNKNKRQKKHQKLKPLQKYLISKLIKMNEEIKCQKWKTMNANFVSNFAQ